MCFTKLKVDQVAVKTDKDLYAFKILLYNEGGLISPYMGTSWVRDKIKVVRNFDKVRMNYGNVNEGIHCYRNIHDAIENKWEAKKIFLVRIPKGSWVYTNETEYCANRMQLLKEIRIPKK